MKHFALIVTLLIILGGFACKRNSPEPVDPCLNLPEDENATPGRRDYTWTADTLRGAPGELIFLRSIWGSSPTDIWAGGEGGTASQSLWHYDGNSWSMYPTPLDVNFSSIFGFSQNNIWSGVGGDGNIYHFNGSEWQRVGHFTPPGYYSLSLEDIWGQTPEEVYAVGGVDKIDGYYKGVIMRYEGSQWQFVSIPEIRISFYQIRRGLKDSEKYYLAATRFEQTGDTNKIFVFDGVGLKEIYATTNVLTIEEVNGRMYFIMQKKIHKYVEGQFCIWKDFSATNFLGRMWGRSSKDFFAVGRDGILHYNGSDLTTVVPTDLYVSDAMLFGRDVFFLCYEDNINLPVVLHGTLQPNH